MKHIFRVGLVAGLAVLLALPIPVEAMGLGSAAARAALKRMLAREAARDAKTAAVSAARSHQLMRYTTAARARGEAASGLAAGRHLTGRSEGAPLTAEAAQRRYGLPARPEVRETWSIPRGWPERRNPVWQGEAGVGEVTSPKQLSPDRLIRVEKLPPSERR